MAGIKEEKHEGMDSLSTIEMLPLSCEACKYSKTLMFMAFACLFVRTKSENGNSLVCMHHSIDRVLYYL